MIVRTQLPEPTGTVDLLTTTASGFRYGATLCAADCTCDMSGIPPSPVGVPTQRKITSASLAASAASAVNRSRPVAIASSSLSCRPGSWSGSSPADSCSALAGLVSNPTTSCPSQDRQTAVTEPTYPVPTTATFAIAPDPF